MAVVLGLDAKLYRQTGTPGETTTPVWSEVANCQEVEVKVSGSLAEAVTRGASFKKTLPGANEFELSFTLIADSGDTDFQAFRDAKLNRTVVDVAAAEGDIANGDYWRCVGYVEGFEKSEPLEDMPTVKVTIKPALGYADPSWNA